MQSIGRCTTEHHSKRRNSNASKQQYVGMVRMDIPLLDSFPKA